MRKIRLLQWAGLVLLCLTLQTASAYAEADNALIVRGVFKTLFSAFEIPKGVIQGSVQSFPVGIVTGAVGGAFRTVAGTLSGALDIAKGGAPYAKYAVFL